MDDKLDLISQLLEADQVVTEEVAVEVAEVEAASAVAEGWLRRRHRWWLRWRPRWW